MIRLMTEHDADAAAALIREAFGSIETPLDPVPSALRETGRSVRAQLAQGGGAVWDQDGMSGCILWREQGGGLYLCRLAVRPARQRHGIARRLLAYAESEARSRQLPRLHLNVRLRLAGNRRLFASAGFTERDRHAHPGYSEPTFADAEKMLD